MLLARLCTYFLLLLASSVDARDLSVDEPMMVQERIPRASRRKRHHPIAQQVPVEEDKSSESPPVVISLDEQELAVLAGENNVETPMTIEVKTTEEPPKVVESESPQVAESVLTEATESSQMPLKEELPPVSGGGPPPPRSGPPIPPPQGPPPPPMGVATPARRRQPDLKLKGNLNCKPPPRTQRSLLKETIYEAHLARLEEFEERRAKLNEQLQKVKDTDKEAAERLQKEIDNITLLPPPRADRFKTLFTVAALTKKQEEALAKNAKAQSAGEKAGLGLDSKYLMNVSLLGRGVKGQLHKQSEIQSYRTPADIPNTEVVGAILSMHSGLDGFDGIKKLLPESDTCVNASKLLPEQMKELVEAEDLIYHLCQGGLQDLQTSIESQASLVSLSETFAQMNKQADACLNTARAVLSSEALKAIITEATAIVAHAMDQFSPRPVTFEYLSLIDLIEMKGAKAVDDKRTFLQEALESVKPELLEAFVKEFNLIREASACECTSLKGELRKAETSLAQLRNRLEMANNNESNYKTVAEMDFNLGIMARKELITSLEARVPDIKNLVQQFEELFHQQVVKYLGAQPILCPSAETISAVQNLGGKLDEVCTKMHQDLVNQSKLCDPGSAKTTTLNKLLEFLVNAAEAQNKARAAQRELEEKAKGREAKAREREARLNEAREKRQAAADKKARERLKKQKMKKNIKSHKKAAPKGTKVHVDEA